MGFLKKLKKLKKSYDTYSKTADKNKIERNKRELQRLKGEASILKQKASIQKTKAQIQKLKQTSKPSNNMGYGSMGTQQAQKPLYVPPPAFKYSDPVYGKKVKKKYL